MVCTPDVSPEGRHLALFVCTGISQTDAASCQLEVVALNAELSPQGTPRVIAGPLFPSGLAWGEDGSFLVIGSTRAPGSSTLPGSYLWRVPVSGAVKPQRLELAGPDAGRPVIDGKRRRLVFSRGSGKTGIWQCTPGGNPSPLVETSSFNPQYSHDGRRIAFQSRRSTQDYDIWIANADGTGLAQITRGLSSFCGTARWSPDDRRIAFDATGKDGRWNVWVVEASGGPPRALTQGPGDSVVPSWSHDGTSIYFNSNRSGRTEIWRASAQGGQAEQITRAGGYVAFESSDGKTLYYTKSSSGTEGLFAMSLAGGGEIQLIKEPVVRRGFAVLSDGIEYITGQAPKFEVRFHEFTTRHSKKMGVIEGFLTFGFAVSPDRKTFLFSKSTPGADLWMIENFR